MKQIIAKSGVAVLLVSILSVGTPILMNKNQVEFAPNRASGTLALDSENEITAKGKISRPLVIADAHAKVVFEHPLVSSFPAPKKPEPAQAAEQSSSAAEQGADEDITTSGDSSIEAMQKAAQVRYLAFIAEHPPTINPPANPGLAKVAELAKSFAGKTPYVWGGVSATSGWDCSGFTQYVYREATGKTIPRTEQWTGALRISMKDALPGDLLVMNNGSHVAIYLGDNMAISALNPSVGTIIHNINIMPTDFYRVLPVGN